MMLEAYLRMRTRFCIRTQGLPRRRAARAGGRGRSAGCAATHPPWSSSSDCTWGPEAPGRYRALFSDWFRTFQLSLVQLGKVAANVVNA